MSDQLRLFIAVELPAEVQAVVRLAQERVQAYGRLPVRWVDPSGAHLTLKFLGGTPTSRVPAIVAALEQAAQLHGPFALSTAALGVFPNARAPRVIWIGLGGALAQLRALQADVERFVAPLGFATEQRPFSPHLTLARVEKDTGKSELAAVGRAVEACAAPTPVAWQVARIALVRSELARGGAHYTSIAHAGLDIAGADTIMPATDEPATPARS